MKNSMNRRINTMNYKTFPVILEGFEADDGYD